MYPIRKPNPTPLRESAGSAAQSRIVCIPAGNESLEGCLGLPVKPGGLVVFAHGGGSSQSSPRNTFVAETLQKAGFATLLVDLLTAQEDARPDSRFDVPLLGNRLHEVLTWIRKQPETRDLPLGYFGVGTGASAALIAAAHPDNGAKAVVSRGGRPDLAGPALRDVRVPTLLIIGGRDIEVLDLNDEALHAMRCRRKCVVVPGASQLFEEPGTLEEATTLAADWFERHLR